MRCKVIRGFIHSNVYLKCMIISVYQSTVTNAYAPDHANNCCTGVLSDLINEMHAHEYDPRANFQKQQSMLFHHSLDGSQIKKTNSVYKFQLSAKLSASALQSAAQGHVKPTAILKKFLPMSPICWVTCARGRDRYRGDGPDRDLECNCKH